MAKKVKEGDHSLKVQSICSHVGHCSSVCSLLCEKTKEPNVGKMDISCLYYVDDLKLYDNSKPQPNKVWNIPMNVSEDRQIKFGMVICKSVGLAQGQLTHSLSENFRTSWVSLKGKSIHIDFLKVKKIQHAANIKYLSFVCHCCIRVITRVSNWHPNAILGTN